MAQFLNFSASASEPLFITLALPCILLALHPKRTGLLYLQEVPDLFASLQYPLSLEHPSLFTCLRCTHLSQKALCLYVIVISSAGENVGEKALLHSSWEPTVILCDLC